VQLCPNAAECVTLQMYLITQHTSNQQAENLSNQLQQTSALMKKAADTPTSGELEWESTC